MKKIVSFLVAAVVADILFFKKSSDFIIFGILVIYSIFIKMFNLKSRSTFFISLALLIMMFVNYLFSKASISTEKAAVWLVLFLIVGVIQQWKE